MKNSFLLILLSALIISCQSDTGTKLPDGISEFMKAASKAYNEDPSPLTANNYVKGLVSELGNQSLSEEDKRLIMEEGIKICDEYNLNNKSLSFLFPLVKNYPANDQTNDLLYKMANTMHSLKKNQGANVIFTSLKDRDPKYTDGATKVTETFASLSDYIDTLGARIFLDPNTSGVNKIASQNYVDACESYALANPNDEQAPQYLFKAAEIARTIRTFPKVMSLYDWITNKYPKFEKSPTVLFLKGFVLENDLKNEAAAKEAYAGFLEAYPDHELADDVQFLLDNIGKSDEEILKIIESKKQNN